MRQYQVPQFITRESRIIGQVTVKQFLYLGSGALGIFLAYKLLARLLFTITALGIAGFSAALAFYKVDGQPFSRIVAYAILYSLKPHLYIWETQKPHQQKTPQPTPSDAPSLASRRRIAFSKISDLAWSLNVQDHRDEHADEDTHISHQIL